MLSRIKATKGFTLLELLVVLLIIGILAAIAVPSYQAVRTNAAERAVTQSAEMLARNAEAIAFAGGNGAVSLAEFNIALAESSSEENTLVAVVGADADNEEDTFVTLYSGSNPRACIDVTLVGINDASGAEDRGAVVVDEDARNGADCEEEDDD